MNAAHSSCTGHAGQHESSRVQGSLRSSVVGVRARGKQAPRCSQGRAATLGPNGKPAAAESAGLAHSSLYASRPRPPPPALLPPARAAPRRPPPCAPATPGRPAAEVSRLPCGLNVSRAPPWAAGRQKATLARSGPDWVLCAPPSKSRRPQITCKNAVGWLCFVLSGMRRQRACLVGPQELHVHSILRLVVRHASVCGCRVQR